MSEYLHEVTPNGWVDLRKPRMVAERYRRPIIAKMTEMGELAGGITKLREDGEMPDAGAMSALYEYNDLVAVALIAQWSWDVPVSVDALLDLPGEDYDAILKVTAPFVTELMPSFGVDPDPKATTEPSGESLGLSTEEIPGQITL